MNNLLLVILGMVCFSCNGSDGIKELGNSYFLRIEGAGCNEIINRKPNIIGIPPDILEYYVDDSIIIVKQQPTIPIDVMHEPIKYPQGISVQYYWIIDKWSNFRYGPMLQDSFLNSKIYRRCTASGRAIPWKTIR